MKARTYLNAILTVNAVLLTGLLWTQVASRPIFAEQADAQSAPLGGSPGIPNAAEQRGKMIELLRELKSSVDGAKAAIEGGKIRVEVTNLDEIKIDTKK